MLVALTLSALLPALALAENPASRPDPSCAITADTHESAARISERSLALANECVDTGRVRPVVGVARSGSRLAFFNYYYRKAFWRAELDLRDVATALFHVKRFPTIEGIDAAHTQLRFRMKPGKFLHLRGQEGKETAEVNEILVSFETAAARGRPVSFAFGAVPNFPLVGRVGHTEAFMAEHLLTLEQYELALDDSEVPELLTIALARSQAIGLDTFYLMLRPNCTTEALDILDQLPRMKNRFPRFLSVISTDPVAGPSLRAIRERGLLRRRVQDYAEEQKGIETELPLPADRVRLPPFVPSVPNAPWTAVVVAPDPATLSRAEQDQLATLKRELLLRLFGALQSYGASSLQRLDAGEISRAQAILSALGSAGQEARQALHNAESSVPAEGRTLSVYLVPMKSDGQGDTSLEALGINAALPFSVKEIRTADAAGTKSDAFYWVGAGARRTAEPDARPTNVPAFFMGLAVVANVVPGASTLSTQLLVGLNGQTHALSAPSPKASIDSLVVPQPTGADGATVLISHVQNANEKLETEARAEFGPFGGLAGTLVRNRFGGFQILRPLDTSGDKVRDCEARAQSVPRFTGVFGASPTGNSVIDAVLKGRPVAFHLLSLRFDLATLTVKKVDLGVSSWPVQCRDNAEAEEEFRRSANEAVNGAAQKALAFAQANALEAIWKKLLGN